MWPGKEFGGMPKPDTQNVACMGNCATGPAIRIDGRLHSHVTPEKFDALLAHQEDAQ